MGGAHVALLVALLAAQGWAEEIVLTLNTKKAVHSLSDKFLSVTLDPATLMQGDELGSGTVCTLSMARGLAPAYLRLAGPQSNHLRFQRALFPDEQRDNYTITEAHWLVLNHFAQQTGLELVVALAADQRVDGAWDPRNSLELIAFSDKLGFNVSAWQLGYELQRLRGSSGSELGRDVTRLRHILDAFPRYSASVVVAPDVVGYKSREDVEWLRTFTEEAGTSLGVLSWHPKFPMSRGQSADSNEESEAYFPPDSLMWEKEALYRALGRHAGSKRPLWIAESHSGECRGWFLDALQWAHKLGVAARLGANTIFRQPDMRVLLQPTPDYWVSLLHKRLVGGTVLDARLAHGNRSHVHAFSHCAATPLGGVTVWAVNLLDQRVRVSVRAAWGKASVDKTDVHQYVLTAAGEDGLHSGRTLLNGELLALNPSGELPFIQPRIRRLGRAPSMTMPARSIAFWVFPEAQVKPCLDGSHKKMFPKERLKQENSEEDISDYEPDKHKYVHVDRDREDDSKERYHTAAKVKRKIQLESNKHGHRDSTSDEHNSSETREILFGAKNKKKNGEQSFTDDRHTPRYNLKTKNVNSKSGKEYYDEEKNGNSGRRNVKVSRGSSESDSNESGGKRYRNNIQVKQSNTQQFSESKNKLIKQTNTYPKKYQPKHTADIEEKIEKPRQKKKKYEHSESESTESEPIKKAKVIDPKNSSVFNGPKNSDSDEDRSKYQQNKKKFVPFQDQINSNIGNIKYDEDIIKNSTKYDHVDQINETNNGRYNYAIAQHDDSLSSSSENNRSVAEHSRNSEYSQPHTIESHEALMANKPHLKTKFANLISKSPETTSVVPEKVVVMEILHNGVEEGSGAKKSRVVRSVSESGPYIIPGLDPDLYQQQPKVKSTSKRRKEESSRHPRKTKKSKDITKYGKKKDDDLQESIGYDPNKPVSYEDADHLFGNPLPHHMKDDSFPSGDVFLKEAGESQEKNNDYDYVGDEDEKKEHDHSNSEEVTDNEELPSKYHGLGHFFENVRIIKPQIKENLVNYGELWEAEGYGEFEETHNTEHEEEDSKVVPHEQPSEEHDRKIKNKTANMLKSYFDDTRDSKELDMEEEHRKQKMTETAEEYDVEDDSSERTGSGSYPCMHPHSQIYQNSRQHTLHDTTENAPEKARYRAKRQGEFMGNGIFSNVGAGIGGFIDNALTAVPVISRKLLSNGKTSLVFDSGAEGEDRLSKIVDHVVHTIRDFDADYNPKLVSLNLESENSKEIEKRSIDATERNHLSRVHKKQLNSFSEEHEMTKENNVKTNTQNVNTNEFVKTAEKPTDKGNAFSDTVSSKIRNVGAVPPTQQNKVETNKNLREPNVNTGRGAESQTPVPGNYRNRDIQGKDNVLLAQTLNESQQNNNTLVHIRSKRSETIEDDFEPDESENLQKKFKKSKISHLIYEKKLKDSECKKDDDDKFYKEKEFEKKPKKVKLIKRKGDKKKKKRKLKFKQSDDGHSKKCLHYKKGGKGKKTLIKYKRSLYLIDDNDMINGDRGSNSLLTPYGAQHDFNLLESENPYKESTVNGEDFIYFIVDRNDPTAEKNEIKVIGEEIKPESAKAFEENELRSLVKSGRLQEDPERKAEVIYEVLPEHLLDPSFQQEHEVRVVLDSLGNGWEYELTQNDYSVPLSELTDNIPNLNRYGRIDDDLERKIHVITGGMGELFHGISDTGRTFPVERDVEYRIGDIGEYADDYLVYGSGHEEHRQQNVEWPYEEVSEFEISGIDEATHNELSKILGSTMKVLVEMPPRGTFPGSVIEPEVGNENEENENNRNKRSLINRMPFADSDEWYEDGDVVEERVVKKPYKLDGGLRYKYRDFDKEPEDDLFPNETLIKEIIENEAINNEILSDPDRNNNVHRKNFIPRNRNPINYVRVSSTISSTVEDDGQLNSTTGIQTQTEGLGEDNVEGGETENSLTTPEGITGESSDKDKQEKKSNIFNKILSSLSKAYSYVRNLVS